MKILFYSLLFLWSSLLWAQNNNEQSLDSNEKTILIELESLNNLELKSVENTNTIKVICSNCDAVSKPKLLEQHQIVNIKVTSDKNKIYGAQRNKFRAGQPEYPNYSIEVPENREVKVVYNKGNFTTRNFKGNLDIRLNHGNLILDNVKGDVSVISFSGIINCTFEHAAIKVENSKGLIDNKLKASTLLATKRKLHGIYKKDVFNLTIKTVRAKVLLSPVITQ